MDGPLPVSGLAAAPVITALVAMIGAAVPALPRRYYPLLAVGIGVAWQCAVASAAGALDATALLAGVLAGLAACGLYSGAVKPALASIGGR